MSGAANGKDGLSLARLNQAISNRSRVHSCRLVLYSARHTFATDALAATGNMFAVSKAMGHAGVESMKPYQHPQTQPPFPRPSIKEIGTILGTLKR